MLLRPIRSVTVAILVGVAALALSACGGDDQPHAVPANTVEMGDFWYKPAEFTVPPDAIVNIVNVGAVAHSWILQGAGVGTAAIAPGKSIIVDLRGIKPGTYTIYCDEAGHTQAGQTGKLTIA
ncbi:MAG TPA: cupredoxin domain-containing protein [Acidimicrobiales bacterium]|nr:cupredoxin domain-containing protein [Acidimicrobiales bacterium]